MKQKKRLPFAHDHSRTAIKLHGKFDDMPGSKFNCVPPADKMPCAGQ